MGDRRGSQLWRFAMAYEVAKRMAATARMPMQNRRGHESRRLSIGVNWHGAGRRIGGQNRYTTSTPMLRAVPRTDFIADSRVKQFRSGILILAISFTGSSVILPTLVLLGSAD